MKAKKNRRRTAKYTKPELRESLKEKIKKGTKGGKAGQWSARKAQLLCKQYEAQGGGYANKNHPSAAQKNLANWTKKNNK